MSINHGALSAELVVLGDAKAGLHPGSVHVRTLLRYRHPAIARRLACRVSDTEAFLRRREHADIVVVQRTAVAPEHIDAFIRTCDESALPLIVDLDDYLVDPAHASTLPGHGPQQAIALEQLLGAADLVTVSTRRLLDGLSDRAVSIEVVPNLLDEGLWLAGPTPRTVATRQIRILYMGTKTHGRDLALLRTVIPEVAKRVQSGVTLEVVGGEPETAQNEWYSRLHIPPEARNYPQFVRWLRSRRHRWQLAVAPLEDTEFNFYKSDLKFLEYSALGLAGVFSRVPAYEESVRNGETGMLVENTREEWVDLLVELCQDGPSRESIARAASEYVTDKRRLGLEAEQFLQLLARTASNGRRSVSLRRVP